MSIIEEYWGGVLQRLRADVDVLSRLVEHNAERGRANELALTNLLEALLPRRWGIGSGLVIDRHGGQSRQMDVVIYDHSDQPTIFAQTTQLLFPVETVVACVEVKTTVDQEEIGDAAKKLASLADLEPLHGGERPFFALLAYNSALGPDTLAKHTVQARAEQRPDLLCFLQSALIGGRSEATRVLTEYALWVCLLQDLDENGDWAGAYVPTNASRFQERGGNLYPVVRHGGSKFLGDPGRALLLFLESLVRVCLMRRGGAEPVLSGYLDDRLRDRVEIE